MELLGKIDVYFEDKGYGFIQSVFTIYHSLTDWEYGRKSERRRNDVFFHIKDCAFSRVEGINWVKYELGEHNGKIKATNVRKFVLVDDIDYIINHWSDYNSSLKEIILIELEQIFSSGGDYSREILYTMDEESMFYEKFSELLKSTERKKLIEAAQRVIAKYDLSTECKDLYAFFSSIIERDLIGEFTFVQNCKDIIDENIHKVFECKFADLEDAMSKIPSRKDLYPAVISYLQNLCPSISYTYTYEDGYWTTHWKWDGSEDSYVNPKSKSEIRCSGIPILSFRGTDFYHGYSDFGRNDELSKEEIFLEVYSALKDSKRLWNTIIQSYCRKERESLQRFVDDVCKSTLSEISQYFTILFPIYGKVMYDWTEEWKKKRSFCICGFDIEGFLSKGISFASRYDRIIKIAEEDKYAKYDRPDIRGIDVICLKKYLLDINRYLYSRIANMIENRYVSHVKISAFDSETISRDGMLLSLDEKVLYAITNTNLQELVVPSSVSHIGDGAFVGSRNLKKINFHGSITHVGHNAFGDLHFEINGDFSQLSFMGYNSSSSEITIGGEKRTIMEWSYIYNKEIIDNTEITIKEVHIEHDDD